MASVAIPVAAGLVGSLLKPSQGLAALPPQQNFQPQIQQATQNVNSNIANQNAFAQALQTQSQGGGPNLAGSLLSNATGQNVNNQAALMASQRGTGSNAGLIARQAAQQGAGIQQQSAGQAAALRQQQQLNAQQGLSNVYGQIGQESGQQLNSFLSGQNAQNQQILGTNQINAGIGAANNQSQGSVLSGIGQALPGIANAAGGLFSSGGGGTPGTAAGYGVNTTAINPKAAVGAYNQLAEGGEVLPDHLKMISDIYHPSESAHEGYNAATNQYAKGGKVDALVSPGERILEPKDVKKVADGKAHPLSVGKVVPGKPKVPGSVNSYDNDTVPKKLAIGSIVEPRSVTQSKNKNKDASAFVMAIISKQKKKGAK